ncbi:MAG: tetratricopeptide repeat protein, partial [Nitrospiraceae bacterium]
FEEALKLSNNKKIYNNMALALSRSGKDSEAFNNFKKAGNEASAYNNIGYIYLVDGRKEKAAESFEKALETNPGFYVKAHENMEKIKGTAE